MYQWNSCNCASKARVLVLNNAFSKLEVCICIRILWDATGKVAIFYFHVGGSKQSHGKLAQQKKATAWEDIGCIVPCDAFTASSHSSSVTASAWLAPFKAIPQTSVFGETISCITLLSRSTFGSIGIYYLFIAIHCPYKPSQLLNTSWLRGNKFLY